MGNHSNLSLESKLSSNSEQGAQGEATFGIDHGPQHFCTIHAAPMVSTLQCHSNCQSIWDKHFLKLGHWILIIPENSPIL
jgi:hypothetical protein